ncbi:MAG: hypothetical protein L0Z62_17475 [Gemmataceae bacterium]|nr:hypothetical protein [Gemmataceae bacterium]
MPIDPHEFAHMLGAQIAGEVPDVGGGPFGMARLAHILHQRLTPSQGERPGRPTNPTWATRCKVPMSEATFQKLSQLAEQLSTPARKVSPMQVAAQFLEEAVGRVHGTTNVVGSEERAHDANERASSEGVKAPSTSGVPVAGEGTERGPGRKTQLADTTRPGQRSRRSGRASAPG